MSSLFEPSEWTLEKHFAAAWSAAGLPSAPAATTARQHGQFCEKAEVGLCSCLVWTVPEHATIGGSATASRRPRPPQRKRPRGESKIEETSFSGGGDFGSDFGLGDWSTGCDDSESDSGSGSDRRAQGGRAQEGARRGPQAAAEAEAQGRRPLTAAAAAAAAAPRRASRAPSATSSREGRAAGERLARALPHAQRGGDRKRRLGVICSV